MAAAQGLGIDGMNLVIEGVQGDISGILKNEPKIVMRKYDRARERFLFSENEA